MFDFLKKKQPLKEKPEKTIEMKSGLYCPECGSELYKDQDKHWCSNYDLWSGCYYEIKNKDIL